MLSTAVVAIIQLAFPISQHSVRLAFLSGDDLFGQLLAARSTRIRMDNGAPACATCKWLSSVFSRHDYRRQLTELQGELLGQEFTFRFSQSCHCWYAIAGVDPATKPGEYTRWNLQAHAQTGQSSIQLFGACCCGALPFQHHQSSARVCGASQRNACRALKKSRPLKKRSFARPHRNHSGPGVLNLLRKRKISGVFGSARIFNGVKKSQHTGTGFSRARWHADPCHKQWNSYPGPALYFEGNCVMIDHGQGLLTIYMHLSEIQSQRRRKDAARPASWAERRHGTGDCSAPAFCRALAGEYLDPRTLLELHSAGK